MQAQRGFALLEAVAVVAVAAICAGTLALAIGGAAKFGAQANGPHRSAALRFAQNTLRVAQDAWKYGSPGAAPTGTAEIELTVPGPGAIPTTSPARVSATLASNTITAGAAAITVTVTYTPDPGRNDPGVVSLEASLRAAAPLPGSRIDSGAVARPGP